MGFDPVDFSSVTEGDRLRFVTTENGYGGRGVYSRTGTVGRVTVRTVVVNCVDGSRAVIRRADWSARSVHRSSASGS